MELAQHCFPEDFSLADPLTQHPVLRWASDLNQNNGSDKTILQKLDQVSIDFRIQVMTKLKEARYGRDLQRWSTDTESGKRIRLVSRTLRIVQNGNILLFSSRRKKDLGQWPESFRKRKTFSLDQAMNEVRDGPEFAAAVNLLQKHIGQI